MPTISRTNIRVRRTDANGTSVEYPSIAFAYRQLLGSAQELGHSEHQRIRAALRRGNTMRDAHGYTWSAIGEVLLYSSVAAAVAAATGSCQWSDLTFGVEIECKQGSMTDYDIARKLSAAGLGNWRVVRDGSLGSDGHEVVSPVLKGQAGLDSLRKVMDVLKEIGCTVDSRCGLHVHVGARDLPIQAMRNLSMMFLAAETHFDSIVQASRRASVNSYCQSNTTRVGRGDAEAIVTARSIQQLAGVMNGGWSTQHYNAFRYHKLNFQSYAIHGTAEFRQHGGTVESEKGVQWARLITGLVAAAANSAPLTEIPAMSFEQFLAVTDESGQRFFTGRRAAFGFASRVAA